MDALKEEDGKNKQKVVCAFCPSVILIAGDALYTQNEFALPLMTRQKGGGAEAEEEQLSSYWLVADMYDFQNVGFSHTVGAHKYLACADCDMGPIGYHDTLSKRSYVALARVKHQL
ncbi:guanine nucleotide exchange factor MSS4 homolog [Nilaparvata lugens]|uniref:guanine nucleotide exchange factor MSS4 homolog n=1 Tax=Nilaparvata lugens TaxID=108931 RepID=UPI000B98E7FC|nr:guanine nucleotide exchange factor MSS4 homolog [Nilaparvata lugens]